MGKSQSGLSSVFAPPLDLSSVYDPKTGRMVSPQQNKQQEDVTMGDDDAKDDNDDEDDVGREENAATEAAAEPEVWHEVTRTRDRFFTAFARATVFHKDTIQGQKDELLELVWSRKINITDGPHACKVADEAGFRIAVENQEDLLELLRIPVLIADQDGNEMAEAMFRRLDNSQRTSAMDRTVVLFGIHPRTELIRIKSALVRYGEIEEVRTKNCRDAWKMIVHVVFKSEDALKAILQKAIRQVQIGLDIARIGWIGQTKLEWETKFVAKLTGLPARMHSADLLSLIGPEKASYIHVPWAATNGAKGTYQLREAYVYFPSQDVMNEVTKSGVKMRDNRGTVLTWIGVTEKRCYVCGKEGHTQWRCPQTQEEKEQRQHLRNVKAFQKGGPIRLVDRRSFVQVMKGEREQNIMSENNSGQTVQPAKGVQEKREEGERDQPRKDGKTQDSNGGGSGEVERLEGIIVQMQKDNAKLIKKFEEMNRTLLMMMAAMMGGAPDEDSSDEEEEKDSTNTRSKGKSQRAGKNNRNLPPTNILLAQMQDIFTQYKRKKNKSGSIVESNKQETTKRNLSLPQAPAHRMTPHDHSEYNE